MSTDLTTTNIIVQSEGEKVGQQVHTQISSADLSNGIISVWNIDSKGRPTSWRIHNERQQISSTHFTIQLIQIPDDTQEMIIYAEDPLTGEYNELHQVYGIEDLANPDCYFVHYANGIVNFSSNLSGYNVVSSYYGKGVMYISDARIFHNRAGVVVDTLDNILNRAEDGLRLVEEAGGLAQALKEIEEKTEEGIEVIGQIEDTIHSAQMFGCMVDFTKQSFVLKGEKDADGNFRVNAKELSSVYAQLVAYKGGEPMVGLEVVVEDGNDKDVNGKINVYQDNCSISIKDGVLSLHSIEDPTLGRAMARVRIDIPKSQLYVQGDSSGVLSIYKDFEFAIIMDGEDLYNLEMSNSVYSFNGNYDGFIYETQEVEIDFTLTKANVNIDISNLTWQTSSNSALVVQKISNSKVRIIAKKDTDKDKPTVPQNGLIIFNATGRGVTLSKNFVYSVTRDGKSASMLFLTGEQVFLYNNHTCTGYPNKTSLTLTAILQNFAGLATVDWYFLDANNIQTELIDGVNCSISDDSLSCDIYCWDFDEEYTTVPSQELNPWQGRRSVVIRAMVSGAIYDEITLYKMGTGTSGEDSFNVILTNESTTVTLNNSMSLIDNITNIFTDILCYHGSTKLDPNEVQFAVVETHECAIKNNGVFIAPNGEARIQLSDIIEDPEEIETSDDCLSFENGDCFELEDDFGDNGFDFDQDHTNDFEVEETTIYSVVTNDTSYVDFDVIYKGFTVRKRFTISKAIQGANGDTGDKGDSLYLNVLGGTRTITYSQVNTKPRPEYSSTFTAELYNNGVLVDNDLVSYTWKANGHVQGSGYGTYFTPTISPTMDEAIGTNEVIVEATYKTTARINGEFKTVYQTLHYYVPVVVTRDANGLDWVNEWEGTKTLIQDHAVFTPKIFAGSKDEQGRITGVSMGCDFLNDQSSNGLAGYQNDEVSFLLDTDGSLMVGNPFKNDGLGLYYSDGRFTLNVSQMSIVGKDVMTEDNIGNALSGAIQGVKDEFTQEIDDLQEQIDSIDTAIEDALGDGFLSIQDKATVEAIFDTLTIEKDSINKQVEKILANQHLTNEVVIDKVTSNLNTYNQNFNTLSVTVNAILSIESGGQVPPSMIQAFDSALADFSSSTEEIEDIINEALININQQYSDEILANAKEEIQQEVDDLDGALSDLETTMNGEFKSGLISQAKIKALLEHVEIINDEMADITVQYEGMVASTNLNASKKTKLTELHGALTVANATLQASIESSIPDYLFTEQEISRIKTNITNYNKALQAYNVYAQECNADIALNIAQGTVDAITDEEMFNKVTSHGVKQGLFIEDGDLYVNGQYIQAYNFKAVNKTGDTTFFIDSDGNVEIKPTKLTITTTDMKVGGRNFVRNSCFSKGVDQWIPTSSVATLDTTRQFGGHNSVKISATNTTTNKWHGISQTLNSEIEWRIGEPYTISLWYYVEDASTFNDVFGLELKCRQVGSTSDVVAMATTISPSALTVGKWTRLTYTAILTKSDIDYLFVYAWVRQSGTIWITDVQVENSGVATDWRPAPEDTNDEINGVLGSLTDQSDMIQEQFNKITSEDYITASEKSEFIMTYKQTRVEHEYILDIAKETGVDTAVLETMWVNLETAINVIINGSDTGATALRGAFNNYWEVYASTLYAINSYFDRELKTTKTTLTQQKDSIEMAITRSSQNEQQLTSFGQHMKFSDNWLELYGTKNGEQSRFKTRLSDTKLSFFDNGNEVASISNQQLNIDKAEVENTLKVGNIAIKPSGKGGLIFIYEG